MATTYPIRPISEAEFPAFGGVIDHAFGATYPLEPELEHDRPIIEFDRTLAAFDGPAMVGTTTVLSLQVSVPGGVVPVAGVTAVAVLPSHRRRGILSSLMRRQLPDIRDRGEAVAGLFAAEAPIYGRYGYGAATTELDLTFSRGDGVLAPAVPGQAGSGLRLRITGPLDAKPEMNAVFTTEMQARPGLPARDSRWWDFMFWDPEHRRDGFSKMSCVIAEDDTGPRGYAVYSTKPSWDEHGLPSGELLIREMAATDPEAYIAIWNDLLSRDLISRVLARTRPSDEPLLHLLADRRRARPRVADALWIRLISVPEALAQRDYAGAVDVVIEVTDDLLPENQGRWRLQAPGLEHDQKVTCERTSAPADVTLPVQALGAAYLGGTRLGSFAAAGLVTEARPGALAALSAAMSWDPAPWCPTVF